MNTEPSSLPSEAAELIAELALNPELGETFHVGDKELVRALLHIDADEALQVVVVDLITRAVDEETPLRSLFAVSTAELRRGAAIILADLLGETVPAMEEWIRTTRGVRQADLIDLVIAQVEIQKMGVALGKLFMGLALTRALTGAASLPPTSAATP